MHAFFSISNGGILWLKEIDSMNDVIFDYQKKIKQFNVPKTIAANLEKEVRAEFPDDAMLMELHMIRALRAYTHLSCKNQHPSDGFAREYSKKLSNC
jgi:hypothetical protein